MAKTIEITGLTNDLVYGIRLFPRNLKGQYQTDLEGNPTALVTPKADMPITDLPIGSMVKLVGADATRFNNKFKIIDKNHTGYPSNTITLKTSYASASSMTTSTSYSVSNINSYLNSYYDSLPASFQTYIPDTTIGYMSANTPLTTVRKIFAFGAKELFGTGISAVQTQFSEFTTDASRVMTTIGGVAVVYAARDSNNNSSGVYASQTNGVATITSPTNSYYAVGVLNVLDTLTVSSTPDTDGAYIIKL